MAEIEMDSFFLISAYHGGAIERDEYLEKLEKLGKSAAADRAVVNRAPRGLDPSGVHPFCKAGQADG